MKKRDPRINASSMDWKHYLILFLTIMAVSACHLFIYMEQPRENHRGIYLMLSMGTYLVVISFLMMILFSVYRSRLLMKPVERLEDAARRVAQGDFTVHIPPQRRDGKKDEFEVLYDDFNSMTEELASTEMLKKDFVSNVSHELKTPIAVIQNYATILQSEALSQEERQEYTQRIGDASMQLSGLISNILQISRLENQKVAPKCRPYNLSEQLCRCILGYEQILEEKDIDLETLLDQTIMVNSDESLLDIVWNNLISNALKFTEPGGKVQIETLATDGSIRVSVSDSGCGIDAQSLKHIFDKFYQADTSHATKGNGLGLAMVKEITELLGGKVSVESKAGQGSCFTVTLSCRAENS